MSWESKRISYRFLDIGELFSLLNLDDEPENSLKKYLFGRDSPVEEKKKNEDDKSPEEQRADSPLGEFLEQHETKQSDEGVKNREVGDMLYFVLSKNFIRVLLISFAAEDGVW